MGQHRREPPPSSRAYQPKRRRVATSHRAQPERAGARRAQTSPTLRPRYGRLLAFGAATSITAIAVGGLIGVIPEGSQGSPTAHHAAGVGNAPELMQEAALRAAVVTPTPLPVVTPTPSEPAPSPMAQTAPVQPQSAQSQVAKESVPANSGQGRRVVFSISDQRVWLISDRGRVQDSYLVSGSLTDNLKPGSYAVYSRSREAVGIDDSGEMEYFVRFTRGERAAIGFHSIPTKDGRMLQRVSELGTPQSHGCIRQKLSDAKQMWDFAQDGTPVVVTA
jgi:hypothetical protein